MLHVCYNLQMETQNLIDFDDFFLLAQQIFEKQPKSLQQVSQQVHYLLVDEFQDTNALQYEYVNIRHMVIYCIVLQ